MCVKKKNCDPEGIALNYSKSWKIKYFCCPELDYKIKKNLSLWHYTLIVKKISKKKTNGENHAGIHAPINTYLFQQSTFHLLILCVFSTIVAMSSLKANLALLVDLRLVVWPPDPAQGNNKKPPTPTWIVLSSCQIKPVLFSTLYNAMHEFVFVSF